MPTLDASHLTLKTFWKLGRKRIGTLVTFCFISSKLFSILLVHLKLLPFKHSVIGAILALKCLNNDKKMLGHEKFEYHEEFEDVAS